MTNTTAASTARSATGRFRRMPVWKTTWPSTSRCAGAARRNRPAKKASAISAGCTATENCPIIFLKRWLQQSRRWRPPCGCSPPSPNTETRSLPTSRNSTGCCQTGRSCPTTNWPAKSSNVPFGNGRKFELAGPTAKASPTVRTIRAKPSL